MLSRLDYKGVIGALFCAVEISTGFRQYVRQETTAVKPAIWVSCMGKIKSGL